MATHSSILTWTSPWTEEPGRLQSMGLLTLGYDELLSKHTRAKNEFISGQTIHVPQDTKQKACHREL